MSNKKLTALERLMAHFGLNTYGRRIVLVEKKKNLSDVFYNIDYLNMPKYDIGKWNDAVVAMYIPKDIGKTKTV